MDSYSDLNFDKKKLNFIFIYDKKKNTKIMANHLKALLKKNWILWKRNLCCSCCEILLPTLLIFALIGLRSAVTKSDIAEMSYVDEGILDDGPTILYPTLIRPMSQE